MFNIPLCKYILPANEAGKKFTQDPPYNWVKTDKTFLALNKLFHF